MLLRRFLGERAVSAHAERVAGAGPADVTVDDLIAGVEDGILIEGRGSFSIDQQRYNFQFGGDAFWEIKGGKKRGMISQVAYQARTPDFWQSMRRHRRSELLAAVRLRPRWQGRAAHR